VVADLNFEVPVSARAPFLLATFRTLTGSLTRMGATLLRLIAPYWTKAIALKICHSLPNHMELQNWVHGFCARQLVPEPLWLNAAPLVMRVFESQLISLSPLTIT
jgi:hypothetical protein